MPESEERKQILIIDKDIASIERLRQTLGERGFLVSALADGTPVLAAVAARSPKLVIIDWATHGFAEVGLLHELRRLKSPQSMRVVILSALSGEEHVVNGLNLGADDYITKPFFINEVVARVCVLLRGYPRANCHPEFACDQLVLDAATNRVTMQGKLIILRGVEFRLLEFLMSHTGKTFNRTQLLSRVWGGDRDVDERTVDVNVQRLRKILSEGGYEVYIQTVRGFGYRFAPPSAPHM